MTEPTLLRDDADGISVLTINRPQRLNALDYPTIDAMTVELDRIELDPDIGAVILTGAGDRAFSAGADIYGLHASLAQGIDVAMHDFVRRGQALTNRIESFSKPIIVAVNGLAYGGGCEVTEAAPLAIASSLATFAKPEIKLGFPPPFGGSQRLARLIGRKRALGMILTGTPIAAQEALAIGLVNAVVPPDELLVEARRWATLILNQPRPAIAACLTSVTRGLNVSIHEGLAIEAAQFARAAATAEAASAIAAFVARR
jgi:enoyl-CoA hydratase